MAPRDGARRPGRGAPQPARKPAARQPHASRLRPRRRAPRAPSPNRTVDAAERPHRAIACAHFPPCAGCPGIPVPYEQQLTTKRQTLLDALLPLARDEGIVRPTVAAPRLRGYRNQARLVFRRMSRGGVSHVGLGLYLPGTHRVVHIPSCPIQPGLVNAVAQSVTWLAEQMQISVFDERSGTGALRYLALRTDRQNRHVLLTIIVAHDVGPPLRKLAAAVARRHSEVIGVLLHVNARHSNVLFAGEDAWTLGASRLEDQLGDFRIFVSPRSFLQVNHPQAEWIYTRLAEGLGGEDPQRSECADPRFDGPSASSRLAAATRAGIEGVSNAGAADESSAAAEVSTSEVALDLYCGIGGIALHLARPGRLVVGVEESTEAIEDARRAAHVNEVAGIRFVAARVEDFLLDPSAYGIDLPALPLRAVALNPPRTGCRSGVMEALAALAPERIAYVSCRAASLVRDLNKLGDRYVLEEATPVDMIPLTSHIESLCFLRRALP